MLINGGGAVAVLTFFGNVLVKAPVPALDVAHIVCGLKWFCVGLVAATLSCIVGYYVQIRWGALLPASVTDDNQELAFNRHTELITIGAILLSLASLGCFFMGLVTTAGSFIHIR